MCLLHMAKVQLNILDCNGDNNVYVYHKAQPLLDTQNVLGSCTVSLAMGPGSLSPPEKKGLLTSNPQRHVHSWLMQKDAKGPLHRKGAGPAHSLPVVFCISVNIE